MQRPIHSSIRKLENQILALTEQKDEKENDGNNVCFRPLLVRYVARAVHRVVHNGTVDQKIWILVHKVRTGRLARLVTVEQVHRGANQLVDNVRHFGWMGLVTRK